MRNSASTKPKQSNFKYDNGMYHFIYNKCSRKRGLTHNHLESYSYNKSSSIPYPTLSPSTPVLLYKIFDDQLNLFTNYCKRPFKTIKEPNLTNQRALFDTKHSRGRDFHQTIRTPYTIPIHREHIEDSPILHLLPITPITSSLWL